MWPRSPGEIEDQVNLVAAGGLPVLVADRFKLAEMRPVGQVEQNVEPAELAERKLDEPRIQPDH